MSNEEKLARMLLASTTGHAMIRNLARRSPLNKYQTQIREAIAASPGGESSIEGARLRYIAASK